MANHSSWESNADYLQPSERRRDNRAGIRPKIKLQTLAGNTAAKISTGLQRILNNCHFAAR
jgi:hypothetical protein